MQIDQWPSNHPYSRTHSTDVFLFHKLDSLHLSFYLIILQLFVCFVQKMQVSWPNAPSMHSIDQRIPLNFFIFILFYFFSESDISKLANLFGHEQLLINCSWRDKSLRKYILP